MDIISHRFDTCLNLENVCRIITVRPEPVPSLENLHPLIAAEVFSSTLKEIFIPNQFTLNFINEMVHRAYLHHCHIFSSELDYISRIYTPPEIEVSPVCLTGLAGIGKSRTLAALRKVMPPPVAFHTSHHVGEVTLTSHWYASGRGKVSGKSLLAEFMFADADRPVGDLSKFLLEARRRAYALAVSLVMLDETQHINTGLGSAKITEIILNLSSIGPPAVFVGNYSLLHKLLRRNSEDKQRLLSDPRIMLPDDPHSKDWHDYIQECVRVSKGAIRPGTVDFAGEVYRCTFGIKRFVIHLLKQAYIEARKIGRHWIEFSDLTRAYCSAAYTSNASEVEELHRHSLNGQRQKERLDLYCPFKLPAAHLSNVVKFVTTERDKRVISKVFDSALNEKERLAQKQTEVPGTVESKKRPPRAVTEKLSDVEQAKAFFDYIDNSGEPKKPKKR
ncbi:transposase [Pseudomonas sp. JDS28PS106]|uniref:transposase n=1 Tax=Pseudomonas sp. JDS28PS106 TaxID=2497235 RepID=UPI002FD6B784